MLHLAYLGKLVLRTVGHILKAFLLPWISVLSDTQMDTLHGLFSL